MKKKKILSLILVFVAVICLLPCTAWAALIKNGAVGEDIRWEFAVEGISEKPQITTGVLPAGLELDMGEGCFVIYGKPTESGSFFVTVSYTTAEGQGSEDVYISLASGSETPEDPEASDPPKITKHPGGETVYEHGGCVFTSYADDADKIEWYFTNGSETVAAAEAYAKFSGLWVTDYDETEIYLENIPLSMDGWKVYSVFYGAGGSVESKRADIYVLKATPAPTPTPTPAPTSAPTPAPTPTPTAAPTEGTLPAEGGSAEAQGGADASGTAAPIPFEVNGTEEELSTPDYSSSPTSTIRSRESNSTLIIFTGAVLIVTMICATVLYLFLSRDKDMGENEDDTEEKDRK